MNISPSEARAVEPPFDAAKLDRLMEEAGIDVLLATSKHNTQYLLGGYKFIFFAAMDAIGHSRYLPIVVYEKGSPDHSAYVGNRMEGGEHQNKPFWTPNVLTATWGTLDAAELAVEHLEKIGKAGARIGIEPPFLPSDARDLLASRLEEARFVDATYTLERLRAIKTPQELQKLKLASELITDSMLATIAAARGGIHEGRDHRTPQAGGDQSRAPLRILPADPRRQSQPRRLAAGVGEGRGAFNRFRWQLSRLYR
ncbi:Xaa-Pro aminopeptidase [Sinorhizobium fredii]